MTVGDRDGLSARIRQLRRRAVARDQPDSEAGESQPDSIRSLERRVGHLEQLLQGFQDSVHRESERHERLIAELQAQVEPGAMGAALAEDARSRGL
jgi:hypothetical protein